MSRHSRSGRGHRTKLERHRGTNIPANVAAVAWTEADSFTLRPGRLDVARARCVVVRVMEHERIRFRACAVYAPRYAAREGRLVMGPGECVGTFDLKSTPRDRAGFLDPRAHPAAARAALAAYEALTDPRRLVEDHAHAAPLPPAELGFPDGGEPDYEDSQAVRDAARPEVIAGLADAGLAAEVAALPRRDQLRAVFDLLSEPDGDHLRWWPLPCFARRAGRYDRHPVDGSAPPDGDPEPGDSSGGWYERDGRWCPAAQAAERAALRTDGLAGRRIDRENPARRLLVEAGLLEAGDDPAAWDDARREAHRAALVDPARSAWLAQAIRPGGPVAAVLPCSEQFLPSDFLAMLADPAAPPFATLAPRVFLVRNGAPSLSCAQQDWAVDLWAAAAGAGPIVADARRRRELRALYG